MIGVGVATYGYVSTVHVRRPMLMNTECHAGFGKSSHPYVSIPGLFDGAGLFDHRSASLSM